jgi:hypothetical protein
MATINLQTRDGRKLQAPLKGDTSGDDKATQAPLDMRALRDMLMADDDDTILVSRKPAVWEPIILDDEDSDASSNLFTPGPAIVYVDVIPGKNEAMFYFRSSNDHSMGVAGCRAGSTVTTACGHADRTRFLAGGLKPGMRRY